MMDQSRLDEELVRTIDVASEGDDVLRQFLLDLVFEEAEYPGRWRWKNAYREKVKASAKQWKGNDENQTRPPQ